MITNNIKSIRKERGMTQTKLGLSLNLRRESISKLEHDASTLTMQLLQEMSNVLQVQPHDLIPNLVVKNDILPLKKEEVKLIDIVRNINLERDRDLLDKIAAIFCSAAPPGRRYDKYS